MVEHFARDPPVERPPAGEHDDQRTERQVHSRGPAVVGQLPPRRGVQFLLGRDRIRPGRPELREHRPPDAGEPADPFARDLPAGPARHRTVASEPQAELLPMGK
ncbi:hypothetical protein CG736_04120 [Kitasatospora sp. CB02891]|nr:hypothetical protein CG736_04120 [Kitasatospora sp. CB02891]